MSTDVKICSNAALLLGAGTINDFDDGTEASTIAANLYPDVRDAFLRAHPWNAATKRVILAPDADAPAFDYAYQFSIPDDWLKTLQVGELGRELDHRHEGRKLLCDENAVPLRYIWRNENPATWDSMMVWGMTLAMQATMCYGLTKSTSLREACFKDLALFLRSARAIDGQDDPPETLGDFRLLAARHGTIRG